MDYKELRNLSIALAKADRINPTAYSFDNKNYSYDDLQNTLRQELNNIAGDFYAFEQNKATIYRLIAETVDEIFPKKVMARYMDFAEVRTVPQGEEVYFTRKTGKERAKKQFITKVGLAGLYETFRLGKEKFRVEMSAIGGAAQIGLEEWLDGNVDFNDLMEVLMEGMDERIYEEVCKALESLASITVSGGAITGASFDGTKGKNGTRNKAITAPGFHEAKFDNGLQLADAYGNGSPSTIYCTYEFAAKMLPTDGSWASEAMKNAKWTTGYLGNYKGHKVVILPQSYDYNNSVKKINPGYVYIIPGSDKPIKLAFEGSTIIDEFKNTDRSREVQMYKKFGMCVITNPGMVIYLDSTLFNPSTEDWNMAWDGTSAVNYSAFKVEVTNTSVPVTATPAAGAKFALADNAEVKVKGGNTAAVYTTTTAPSA